MLSKGRKIFPGSRVIIRCRSSSKDDPEACDAVTSGSKSTAKVKLMKQLDERQSKRENGTVTAILRPSTVFLANG